MKTHSDRIRNTHTCERHLWELNDILFGELAQAFGCSGVHACHYIFGSAFFCPLGWIICSERRWDGALSVCYKYK